VALAAGALGTFLGIFNTIEINKICREMATMSNNQNLLIPVQKIHTDQILQLEVGLIQLNNIFNIYLKNNPALLYAKLEDVLQSLADRLGDLRDTMQMFQLQRLSTNTHTSFQLTNLYNEITSLAKANNLQTLTDKPQDLFQLDTSYIGVQNEILVLVHVPCSNPSSLLTIYKYVPFPIRVLPNINSNITTLTTIQNIFDISSPTADSAEKKVSISNLMLTSLQLGKRKRGDINTFFYPQQKCQPTPKDPMLICVKDIRSQNLTFLVVV
jgi:hypothetical protein